MSLFPILQSWTKNIKSFLLLGPDDILSIIMGLIKVLRVKMGINLASNERVAVKIMKSKAPFSNHLINSFLNEVRTLVKVNHKNLIKIKDFSIEGKYKKRSGQTKRILYYVMKLAENGQLLRLIQQTQNFNEKLSRYYFKQLIQGIQYLHMNGIAHRDIKTQNIVMDKKFNIKIVDFGFSCQYIDKNFQKIPMNSSQTVGTPNYNAPQILNNMKFQQYYADDIDLFAAGCVLFEMFMKSAPFQTSNFKDEYYKKLMSEDKNQYWKIFASNNKPSKQFKQLIELLLHADPKQRIKIEELKNNIWYKGQVPTPSEIQKQMQQKCKRLQIILKNQQDNYVKTKIKKYKSKQYDKYREINQFTRQELDKFIQQEVLQLQTILKQEESSDGSNSDNKQSRLLEQELYKKE